MSQSPALTELGMEFLKLRRSLSWPIVILLPLVAVGSGAIGTLGSEQGLTDGWHTLWIRSIGFYGMALLPVGIAILGSLVWRIEHRGGNWNALMSTPRATWRIVAGKAAAIALLAGLMQLCLVIGVIAAGKLVFGLPGLLPGGYLLSSGLVVIACVPVAALQSGLSTLFRSFAAPVAIALVATGISTTALLIGAQAAVVSPYALATFATQLGTSLVESGSTSFDASAITPTSGLLVIGIAAATTFGIIALTTLLLERSDTRV